MFRTGSSAVIRAENGLIPLAGAERKSGRSILMEVL